MGNPRERWLEYMKEDLKELQVKGGREKQSVFLSTVLLLEVCEITIVIIS